MAVNIVTVAIELQRRRRPFGMVPAQVWKAMNIQAMLTEVSTTWVIRTPVRTGPYVRWGLVTLNAVDEISSIAASKAANGVDAVHKSMACVYT